MREFAGLTRQPYPHGPKPITKTHSDRLLHFVVQAMCTLSDRIVVDLEVSSPWLLEDVDESFDDDVSMLEMNNAMATAATASTASIGNSNSNRQKLEELRRYALKIQVRSAMTHALLGRVGLRLWAGMFVHCAFQYNLHSSYA